MLFARKEDHSLLTHTCIGATIRIGREIQCFPYAGFLCLILTKNAQIYIYIVLSK